MAVSSKNTAVSRLLLRSGESTERWVTLYPFEIRLACTLLIWTCAISNFTVRDSLSATVNSWYWGRETDIIATDAWHYKNNVNIKLWCYGYHQHIKHWTQAMINNNTELYKWNEQCTANYTNSELFACCSVTACMFSVMFALFSVSWNR